MKLTFALVLLLTIHLSASVYSQQTKLSLDLTNVTIKDALNQIEEQSHFKFLVQDERFDLNQRINLGFNKKTITEILDKIFEDQGVQYVITEKNLILITPQNNKSPGPEVMTAPKNISGKVIDANGQPLPGVTVVVKGTTSGSITDADGSYSLINVPSDAILQFSFVGMKTQEIPVGGREVLNVTMQEATIGLDEVVAIGYGTQRKATLTGSVVGVKDDEIIASPALSISNSIAGLLPGVVALNRSGEPGKDDATVLIRGRNTTGSNTPLVVVDGIQGVSGWQRINPNDIESISVLKDASAAIYGARAANGVILITTKRGTVGKPTISYSFNQGINQPTRLPDMANSASYAEYVNELLVKDGQDPRFTQEEIEKFRNGSDPLNYPDTDWYDECLKDFSLQSQHNLSLRGGTENIKYSISGSFANQDGIFEGGSHNFKTYSIKANLDAQVTKDIKVGVDLNNAIENGNYPAFDTNTIFEFMMQVPFEPVYYPNGLPSAGIELGNNPAVMCTDATGNDNDKYTRYMTKVSFDINIPWVKGLGIDGYYTYSNDLNVRKLWQTPWVVYSYDKNDDTYIPVEGGGIKAPRLTQTFQEWKNNLFNLRCKFEQKFDYHSINAFIALEVSDGKYSMFEAQRINFSSSILDELFAGSLEDQSTDGSSTESGRVNYFGRISYGYKDKYLMDINCRYDGSTSFPKGKRYGFFPGISLAWRLSEEKFILENFHSIDNLKIRMSYGEMGNDQIDPFQYLAMYKLTEEGYNFGQTVTRTQGLIAGVTPNPNITWEVAKVMNVGLDAQFKNGLFGFSVDMFKQRRSNILETRDLAIPDYTGLVLPEENIGVVENKGIELQLTHAKNQGDFTYQVAGNIAYAKNKVIDISEAQNVPEWQKAEGHVLDAGLYYKALGIFRTQAEVDANPVYPGTVVGDLQYEDVNDDGVISAADQVRLDKTVTPEITFGLNASAQYKQFSLFANFSGQTRAWNRFANYVRIAENGLQDLVDNRYTEGSMDSKYPIIPTQGGSGEVSALPSTFWLRDMSFLRLKTLEIAYDIPETFLSRFNITRLKIFLSGTNLFTIDKLKIFDPETSSGSGNFYPQSKIYNIGFNVTF